MRFTPARALAWLAVLLVLLVVGASALRIHDAKRDAGGRVTQLERALKVQKIEAAAWRAAWSQVSAKLVASTDGVTVAQKRWGKAARVAYTIPRTAADTAAAIAQLPELVAAGDALADSAAVLQDAAAAARTTADSTIRAHQRVIATQDSLIALLRYRPRLAGAGALLFDPLARVPATSVQASVRVVGDWSVLTRVDYRLVAGATPFLYVGASRAF